MSEKFLEVAVAVSFTVGHITNIVYCFQVFQGEQVHLQCLTQCKF